MSNPTHIAETLPAVLEKIRAMMAPDCPECQTQMAPGVNLEPFPGGEPGIGGRCRFIRVWRCKACGHAITNAKAEQR